MVGRCIIANPVYACKRQSEATKVASAQSAQYNKRQSEATEIASTHPQNTSGSLKRHRSPAHNPHTALHISKPTGFSDGEYIASNKAVLCFRVSKDARATCRVQSVLHRALKKHLQKSIRRYHNWVSTRLKGASQSVLSLNL